MKQLPERYTNIVYLSFSINFGKEAAILAGLAACDADYITVMNAD